MKVYAFGEQAIYLIEPVLFVWVKNTFRWKEEVRNSNPPDPMEPLCLSAQNGHAQVLKMLLAAGANKDAANYDHGTTPMYWAAQKGHAEVIKMLPGHTAAPPIPTAPRRRLPPTLRKLLCRQPQHSRLQ